MAYLEELGSMDGEDGVSIPFVFGISALFSLYCGTVSVEEGGAAMEFMMESRAKVVRMANDGRDDGEDSQS